MSLNILYFLLLQISNFSEQSRISKNTTLTIVLNIVLCIYMAKSDKTIEKMRNNPKNWQIVDLEVAGSIHQ